MGWVRVTGFDPTGHEATELGIPFLTTLIKHGPRSCEAPPPRLPALPAVDVYWHAEEDEHEEEVGDEDVAHAGQAHPRQPRRQGTAAMGRERHI